MTFIPNLRTKPPGADYPQSNIDVLVNYHDVLEAAEAAGGLVTGIDDPGRYKVGVVGTGPAGMVAAYELLRLGVNVDIFSTDHESYRYGRCWSQPFPDHDQYIAEMGAMRFPPSEVGLFWYLDKFGIEYNSDFPDPGKVDTLLHLNGQSFEWKAGSSAPWLFHTVTAGLEALISDDTTLADGTVLASPTKMTGLMLDGNFRGALAAWQPWIDHFEHLSFGAGLSVIFQLNPTPPGGTPWTDEDMAIFGTIGVGSGGFGPLYSVQFLEIFRLFVNELETDQQFIPSGIASVFDAIGHAEVGGLSVLDHHKNENITEIEYDGDNIKLVSNVGAVRIYDRVIWAAPKWASQTNTTLVEFLEPGREPLPVPGEPTVASAVKEMHTISSSKAFILTDDKFWLKHDLPANIQSDTVIRGLYCLDYAPDDPDGPGVVLVSYTWQDDSAKQIALPSDNESRIKRLVADVARIDSEFAEYLVPVSGDYEKYTIFVDWMTESNYHGAFKLNHPKQDRLLQAAYSAYLRATGYSDPFVYLAGDDVSYMGGWSEGAIETALNAVAAVGVSLGGKAVSPLLFQPASVDYNYSVNRPR
ncbi:flavin monoamine oxidase family protein [Candidatus Poriferisodalis sp.]|uniref:flavin monoamine oxidase family protein n=1 Tax=Candidatus Poriferisodalis sp. TaxID=3101277 RepID=UPI003AF541A8